MATTKITTSIRIEELLHDALRKIAAEQVRSVNNLIEYALIKFVEDYRSKK